MANTSATSHIRRKSAAYSRWKSIPDGSLNPPSGRVSGASAMNLSITYVARRAANVRGRTAATSRHTYRRTLLQPPRPRKGAALPAPPTVIERAKMQEPVVNALSFDVEDWYMGLEIGIGEWGRFEPRLAIGLNRVLALLRRKGARATFFVVGRCAELHPELIRRIAEDGHEIGSHGYSHAKVYEMTPEAFDADLARSVTLLREVTGQPVRGFRAPYFSITDRSRWALDRLARHGIAYDASIYPGPNYRYGIDGSPEHR